MILAPGAVQRRWPLWHRQAYLAQKSAVYIFFCVTAEASWSQVPCAPQRSSSSVKPETAFPMGFSGAPFCSKAGGLLLWIVYQRHAHEADISEASSQQVSQQVAVGLERTVAHASRTPGTQSWKRSRSRKGWASGTNIARRCKETKEFVEVQVHRRQMLNDVKRQTHLE
jgi:hypothetical protein